MQKNKLNPLTAPILIIAELIRDANLPHSEVRVVEFESYSLKKRKKNFESSTWVDLGWG